MKPEERTRILERYNKKVEKNFTFDLQKELHEYCNSDIDILRRGCIELRKQFLDIGNIEPFQYLTIACVCMAIYRSKYLENKTIGVFNNEIKDQFSKGALALLMSFHNRNIQHAVNDGEVKIMGATCFTNCCTRMQSFTSRTPVYWNLDYSQSKQDLGSRI